MPYIKNRANFLLKSVTLWAINDILELYNENITVDIERDIDIKNMPDSKASFCVKSFHGLRDQERRQKKTNLNEIKAKCQTCKKSTCLSSSKKKVEHGFHCDLCV